jgi:hypothetical protein
MLTVTYAECHIYALYAECPYAKCHYAECHYAECCGAFKIYFAPNFLSFFFILLVTLFHFTNTSWLL